MEHRSKQKTLNRGISSGQKKLRKCSTSLIITEIQVKTTLKFHFTPVRMPKTKTLIGASVGEDVG